VAAGDVQAEPGGRGRGRPDFVEGFLPGLAGRGLGVNSGMDLDFPDAEIGDRPDLGGTDRRKSKP